jgi:DNA-binding NarL/FixJ family response regulator
MNCQLVQNAFRKGRERIIVSGSAVDIADALLVLQERDLDVAIVSAQLNSGPKEGFALVRKIHSLRLRTRIIMLLESHERELVVDAFRFGAQGVIFRDEPLETLTKCIHAVHGGQIWASSLDLGYVMEALAQASPQESQNVSAIKRLTKREKEIATLVVNGMTNRDISTQLSLTEHTVRNYTQHVFEKLGVSTRVELILYFRRSPVTLLGVCD